MLPLPGSLSTLKCTAYCMPPGALTHGMLHAGLEWPEPGNTWGRTCSAGALDECSCPRSQPAKPGHRCIPVERQSICRIPCRRQKHIPCQEAAHWACCPQLCPQVRLLCAALPACVRVTLHLVTAGKSFLHATAARKRCYASVYSCMCLFDARGRRLGKSEAGVSVRVHAAEEAGCVCREAPSTFGRSAHKEEMKRKKRAVHAGKAGKRSRQK